MISGQIPEQFGNLSSLRSLILENNHLTGNIPDSLGKLSKIQTLILSQNNLSGNIPDSLSSLSNLNDIGLAYNHLTGQIPNRLFQVARYKYGQIISNLSLATLLILGSFKCIKFPKISIDFNIYWNSFTGNNLNCSGNFPSLCVSNTSDTEGSHCSKILLILGSIGGAIVLILGVAIFLLVERRRGLKLEAFVDVPGEDGRRIAFGQLKRFSWRELEIATDSFNDMNIVGKGAFGNVYEGVLHDNKKIAVKRLNDYESPGGETAFLRELELISVAVHRNLLRLMGFCTTPTERLLVYPFMQNLSVAHHLRDFKPGKTMLDWNTRKRVALGTARGLEYLHEHCIPKIIHRDVKAANVLLDEDFEAIVGDFGLAKLVDVRKTSVTTQVRGTMWHIAPEYLSTGKSSERTDVFGYGIMPLELVTGQCAIDFSRLEAENDVLLLDHVKKLVREKRLGSIIDRNLSNNYTIPEVEKVIQIAFLCTQATPEDRPSMSEVVRMLEEDGLSQRWEEWQQVEEGRSMKCSKGDLSGVMIPYITRMQ